VTKVVMAIIPQDVITITVGYTVQPEGQLKYCHFVLKCVSFIDGPVNY
jgi:hypothetical protein